MRSLALSTAALPLAAQAMDIANKLAFVDDNRMVELPGILRYPVEAKQIPVPVSKNNKRQNEASLDNQRVGLSYLIDIEIGTPGQTVKVAFDTGSDELWVNPDCSTSGDPEYCQSFGRFTESESLVPLGTKNHIQYGLGEVDFDYVKDFIGIGSAKLTNQTFGVGYQSEYLKNGIMGAGPNLRDWESPYPLLIDSLAQQGKTNSRAFSVDLRGVENARGAVIFGGIDKKKFKGALKKLPVIPAAQSPDGYNRWWVKLDGINIDRVDGTNHVVTTQSQSVFLDTGATLSYLPPDVVTEIANGFDTEYDAESDLYFVDCAVTEQDKSVNFEFGETTIQVPYKDFIWQIYDSEYCALGLRAAPDLMYILGDSFLRGVYAVMDMDNRNIWIANNEDCGTHLVPIGSGPDAITAMEGECGATTTSTTSTTAPTSTKATSTKDTSETSSKTSMTETTTAPPTGTAPTSSGVISSSKWSNSTTTAKPTYTSTFTTTSVYTVTSCPPVVTDCPVGKLTTEIITSYTTYCPGDDGYPTETATHGDCPGGPNCPQPTHTGGNQCPGPNCPHPSEPVDNCPGGVYCPKPTHTGGNQCPGPNCPKPTHTGGNQCPGPNCPQPTGGMTTVNKPTGTQTSKPQPPVVTGAAEVIRASGLTVLAAAVAAALF